jgi:RimJ/RimL family protein N-acetyltransferase
MDSALPGRALPLPLYESVDAGTITGRDGASFSVRIGLDRALAAEVREHSLDESDAALQAETSDRKRFGTGSYEEWYAKGRVPFALTDSAGKLAALIWFGPEALLGSEGGAWDTIAFRAYPPYRGAGLMTPFSRFVLDFHAERFPERRLWLATNETNEAGRALYRKLGFTERARSDDRIVMTQH